MLLVRGCTSPANKPTSPTANPRRCLQHRDSETPRAFLSCHASSPRQCTEVRQEQGGGGWKTHAHKWWLTTLKCITFYYPPSIIPPAVCRGGIPRLSPRNPPRRRWGVGVGGGGGVHAWKKMNESWPLVSSEPSYLLRLQRRADRWRKCSRVPHRWRVHVATHPAAPRGCNSWWQTGFSGCRVSVGVWVGGWVVGSPPPKKWIN